MDAPEPQNLADIKRKNYAKARQLLLQLFIDLDESLPSGQLKEKTLSDLTDTTVDTLRLFARG
jgi:hypothetical protein